MSSTFSLIELSCVRIFNQELRQLCVKKVVFNYNKRGSCLCDNFNNWVGILKHSLCEREKQRSYGMLETERTTLWFCYSSVVTKLQQGSSLLSNSSSSRRRASLCEGAQLLVIFALGGFQRSKVNSQGLYQLLNSLVATVLRLGVWCLQSIV